MERIGSKQNLLYTKGKVEPAWAAREENRKSPGRRFLPFEDFYLFHSELAGGARQ